MKRWKAVWLAALLCLAAACSSVGDNSLTLSQSTVKNTVILPSDTKPVYQISPVTEEMTYTAKDGTVLANTSYQVLEISVSNLEELSEAGVEMARQVVGHFNQRMDKRLSDASAYGLELKEMAEDAYASGFFDNAYSNSVHAEATLQGSLYSIRFSSSSYSGGAHPNSYTDSYLFDLDMGQYIDPAQVADDPVAFQTGAAELFLEKAQEQDEDVRSGYYPEYADVISQWYDGTVLFDSEGMTAVFSPYELGPYAMGTVELKLSYEEIWDLLGPGGLARLGLVAEENVQQEN